VDVMTITELTRFVLVAQNAEQLHRLTRVKS